VCVVGCNLTSVTSQRRVVCRYINHGNASVVEQVCVCVVSAREDRPQITRSSSVRMFTLWPLVNCKSIAGFARGGDGGVQKSGGGTRAF
jgi:hypothetical protein